MPEDSRPSHRELILRSRAGDELALGELLQQHRDWLKNVAETELNGRASRRMDASDIVQQTLLSALHGIKRFAGSTSGEFAAWLACIHRRNIRDALRQHVEAQKRTTAIERPAASRTLAAGDTPVPSDYAIRNERAVQLRQYLDSLPGDQAEALRLRHLEGWSLVQLTEHFGRSRDSVASLLKRGVENLRKRVRDD